MAIHTTVNSHIYHCQQPHVPLSRAIHTTVNSLMYHCQQPYIPLSTASSTTVNSHTHHCEQPYIPQLTATCTTVNSLLSTTTPQPFYGPFSGTTRVSRCQKRTSGLVVQGKINRGRHIDHPAGRHSIRTKQCPPPPYPIFYRPEPFLPPNQQCQSTEGN